MLLSNNKINQFFPRLRLADNQPECSLLISVSTCLLHAIVNACLVRNLCEPSYKSSTFSLRLTDCHLANFLRINCELYSPILILGSQWDVSIYCFIDTSVSILNRRGYYFNLPLIDQPIYGRFLILWCKYFPQLSLIKFYRMCSLMLLVAQIAQLANNGLWSGF
jgi:hypothetical protein